MLFFDGLLCSRIGQKQCCTKCEWYPKGLFQTALFCNKFQVKLFLFQWFGPVSLSSSSPKVGICSNRSNLHMPSFLWFVPVLWIIDKHCNKIIEPATNKNVGHTPAVYKRSHFTGFLQLISDCIILTRTYEKKETCLKFLWKNSVSKRNVLVIRSEKNFHLWWTDRCFQTWVKPFVIWGD